MGEYQTLLKMTDNTLEAKVRSTRISFVRIGSMLYTATSGMLTGRNNRGFGNTALLSGN